MNTEQILQRVRSCLKLLLNPFIDWDIARELLDTLDMETILALQVILIIGMEGMEHGDIAPAEDPMESFAFRIGMLPFNWDDPEQERIYLLQPDYQKYLRWGMHILGLDISK